MSAIGADANSSAAYARSKAEGEARARANFPGAIVLRPSIVFGPEDDFFNRFAEMARFSPFLPLIGGGETQFQPVFAGDVGEAVARLVDAGEADGTTYELGGPEAFSFRQLMQFTLDTIGRSRLLLPLPWGIAKVQAAIMGLMPKPLLTLDQVETAAPRQRGERGGAARAAHARGPRRRAAGDRGNRSGLSLPLPQGRSVHRAQGNSGVDHAPAG